MPHETEIIVRHSILDPWTQPETHPGVAEHFTADQIYRINVLAANTDHWSILDRLFVIRMLAKLVLTAA